MYKVYDNVIYVEQEKKIEMLWVACTTYVHSCLTILLEIIHHLLLTGFFSTDCLFFCKLKINHDSPEFILEFGTIANIFELHTGCQKIMFWHTSSRIYEKKSAVAPPTTPPPQFYCTFRSSKGRKTTDINVVCSAIQHSHNLLAPRLTECGVRQILSWVHSLAPSKWTPMVVQISGQIPKTIVLCVFYSQQYTGR